MTHPASRPEPATAPPAFRDALAELVQIGLRVARMVGQSADAETALAESASQAKIAEGISPLATSLAEAIEADRAAAAAAETRHTIVARTETIAAAFARTSRAIRLTIMLAERIDRAWARPSAADDHHAMTRRQIARAVTDAISREAEGERAEYLTTALAARLEALDTEAGLDHRPASEIIAAICRDLGLDPARMTIRPPVPGAIVLPEMDQAAPRPGSIWPAHPPRRQPDG